MRSAGAPGRPAAIGWRAPLAERLARLLFRLPEPAARKPEQRSVRMPRLQLLQRRQQFLLRVRAEGRRLALENDRPVGMAWRHLTSLPCCACCLFARSSQSRRVPLSSRSYEAREDYRIVFVFIAVFACFVMNTVVGAGSCDMALVLLPRFQSLQLFYERGALQVEKFRSLSLVALRAFERLSDER
jgi:hypothetical protein